METIATLLRAHGHEVKIFAAIEGKTRFSRLVGLFFSVYNPLIRFRLQKVLRSYRPEVVWGHSVTRAIGPTGLGVLAQTSAQKIITYHDLGYFGAYATKFEHESELGFPQSFSAFCTHLSFLERCFPLYANMKYWKIKRLARVLREFDVHIVPANFMTSAVKNFLGESESDVRTIPHAIQL